MSDNERVNITEKSESNNLEEALFRGDVKRL